AARGGRTAPCRSRLRRVRLSLQLDEERRALFGMREVRAVPENEPDPLILSARRASDQAHDREDSLLAGERAAGEHDPEMGLAPAEVGRNRHGPEIPAAVAHEPEHSALPWNDAPGAARADDRILLRIEQDVGAAARREV